MGLLETEETDQFTFEPFAAHTFYIEINRSLVQKALTLLAVHPAHERLKIVDMACGTGAITRLIAEEMARQGTLYNDTGWLKRSGTLLAFH